MTLEMIVSVCSTLTVHASTYAQFKSNTGCPPPVSQQEAISPVLQSSAAINSSVRHGFALTADLPPSQIALQQIQQAGHGAEQQHSVPSAMQLDEDFVQHAQLATLAQHLCLVCDVVWRVAQGWVVAHLQLAMHVAFHAEGIAALRHSVIMSRGSRILARCTVLRCFTNDLAVGLSSQCCMHINAHEHGSSHVVFQHFTPGCCRSCNAPTDWIW